MTQTGGGVSTGFRLNIVVVIGIDALRAFVTSVIVTT